MSRKHSTETLNTQHSTLNTQHSTLNTQHKFEFSLITWCVCNFPNLRFWPVVSDNPNFLTPNSGLPSQSGTDWVGRTRCLTGSQICSLDPCRASQFSENRHPDFRSSLSIWSRSNGPNVAFWQISSVILNTRFLFFPRVQIFRWPPLWCSVFPLNFSHFFRQRTKKSKIFRVYFH